MKQKFFPNKTAQYTALIALSIVSLPLLLQLPILIIALFVGTLLIRFLLVSLNVVALALWQSLLAIIAIIALVYFHLNTLVGRDGGITFLLFLALLKSFEGGTIRDWQVLLLASLFLVVGPLLFNQSIATALWMALSLYSILVALASINKIRLKNALSQAALGLVLTMPLMGILFIATPRLPEPLWRMPQQINPTVSGLSETLNPGSVAELIQSNALAFNAVFNHTTPPKNQMYWRLMIMGDFDGTSWRAMPTAYPNQAQPIHSNSINYTLTLADQNGRIPVLDYPIAVDENTKERVGATVITKHSYAQLRRVTLTSSPSNKLPEKLNQQEIQYYLQITPNNYLTQSLARNLAKESLSAEIFIQKSLQYLANNNFKYTLTPPKLDHLPNQIDSFLFQSKQGFCEHYASAFTFLMRSGGLPTRIVTGYQGGTYYKDGDFWQVRSKDAHAWVEVWLSTSQEWLRIDPTTVVAADRIENGIEQALPLDQSIQNKSGLWYELQQKSQFQWQQWVVGFDISKQNLLFSWLGLKHVNATSILLIILIGGCITLIPIYLWWHRTAREQFNLLSHGFYLLKQKILPQNWATLASMGPLELLEYTQENYSNQTVQQLKPLLDEFIKLHYQNSHPRKSKIWYWYAKTRCFKLKNNELNS